MSGEANPDALSIWEHRILYYTGAQEWHIVSLLGDVTSPTTVAHYVTMTSDYVF